MSDTLILGAPSLRREDARHTLDKRLAAVKFPVTVQVANHQPFHVSFPAAGRLYLRPSGHAGDTGTATFADAATFARFVTDVQAVADLHKIEAALTVTLPSGPRSAPAPAPAPTPEPAPSAKPAPAKPVAKSEE